MPTMTSTRRHLHIDPFSGIAGDMLLGALLDVAGTGSNAFEAATIRDALVAAGADEQVTLTAERVSRHGIGALDLRVCLQPAETHAHSHTHEPHDHDAPGEAADHHHHHHHHHSTRAHLHAIADRLTLSPTGRERATAVIDRLAEAEAEVHGTTPDRVHFHEVGAHDSIADMLGCVWALDQLGIASVSCGPLPLSSGFVRCDHGVMPVPAPATALLMRGMPTVGTPRRGELVTPTGAALLAAVVTGFGPPPPMVLRAVGYGAGDRTDPEIPNLLRVMLGDAG